MEGGRQKKFGRQDLIWLAWAGGNWKGPGVCGGPAARQPRQPDALNRSARGTYSLITVCPPGEEARYVRVSDAYCTASPWRRVHCGQTERVIQCSDLEWRFSHTVRLGTGLWLWHWLLLDGFKLLHALLLSCCYGQLTCSAWTWYPSRMRRGLQLMIPLCCVPPRSLLLCSASTHLQS